MAWDWHSLGLALPHLFLSFSCLSRQIREKLYLVLSNLAEDLVRGSCSFFATSKTTVRARPVKLRASQMADGLAGKSDGAARACPIKSKSNCWARFFISQSFASTTKVALYLDETRQSMTPRSASRTKLEVQLHTLSATTRCCSVPRDC